MLHTTLMRSFQKLSTNLKWFIQVVDTYHTRHCIKLHILSSFPRSTYIVRRLVQIHNAPAIRAHKHAIQRHLLRIEPHTIDLQVLFLYRFLDRGRVKALPARAHIHYPSSSRQHGVVVLRQSRYAWVIDVRD